MNNAGEENGHYIMSNNTTNKNKLGTKGWLSRMSFMHKMAS